MTHPECIVVTFLSFRKAADTFIKTVCMKDVPAAGEDLMSVRLVPDIPHQLVVRRIKNMMECNGELNHSEAGPEVSAFDRNHVNDELAKLPAKLRKLIFFQLSEVGGNAD